MYLILIGPRYFLWHYSAGIVDLLRVWRNLLWATAHFFSLWLMLTTLIAPWRRMIETVHNPWDIKERAFNLTLNLMSRFVGFTIRLVVLLSGTFVTSVVALCGIVVGGFWLIAPLVVAGAAVGGVYYIVLGISSIL